MDGRRLSYGLHGFNNIKQFSNAISVTAGKHTVDVRQWSNPGVPPAPPRAALALR